MNALAAPLAPGARVPSFGSFGTVVRVKWNPPDDQWVMLVRDDDGHTQWGYVK